MFVRVGWYCFKIKGDTSREFHPNPLAAVLAQTGPLAAPTMFAPFNFFLAAPMFLKVVLFYLPSLPQWPPAARLANLPFLPSILLARPRLPPGLADKMKDQIGRWRESRKNIGTDICEKMGKHFYVFRRSVAMYLFLLANVFRRSLAFHPPSLLPFHFVGCTGREMGKSDFKRKGKPPKSYKPFWFVGAKRSGWSGAGTESNRFRGGEA